MINIAVHTHTSSFSISHLDYFRGARDFLISKLYLLIVQVAEVASAMLDSKLVSVFNKYPDVIDTIHFSDQYTGPKPADVSQF